jgi:hypothetical protein
MYERGEASDQGDDLDLEAALGAAVGDADPFGERRVWRKDLVESDEAEFTLARRRLFDANWHGERAHARGAGPGSVAVGSEPTLDCLSELHRPRRPLRRGTMIARRMPRPPSESGPRERALCQSGGVRGIRVPGYRANVSVRRRRAQAAVPLTGGRTRADERCA